jgi:hypothetical protein
MDDKTLLVESSVSSGSYQPIVVQTYGDNVVTMSAEAAKIRAIAILQAIAYADSEAVFFKTLTGLSSSKGFGKIPPKDLKMAVTMLQMIRDNRQDLPTGISAIFGFNTQKPLVVLEWDDVKIQMELDTALHHASCLLEAAEAAQSDSFLYQFVTSNFDVEHEEVAVSPSVSLIFSTSRLKLQILNSCSGFNPIQKYLPSQFPSPLPAL